MEDAHRSDAAAAAGHPFIELVKATLILITHPDQACARDNYIATASRVLIFVEDKLRSIGHPPANWVDLLLVPKIIKEYLEK